METSISASSAAASTSYLASQTSATSSTRSPHESVEKSIEETIVNATVNNQVPDTQALKGLVKDANTLIKTVSSNLQFQIDDSTKQVVVKIVDSNTGDVIRQIPTVEMLDFMRRMKELEGNAGALLKAVA